jgi:hypothetical protein
MYVATKPRCPCSTSIASCCTIGVHLSLTNTTSLHYRTLEH